MVEKLLPFMLLKDKNLNDLVAISLTRLVTSCGDNFCSEQILQYLEQYGDEEVNRTTLRNEIKS